MAELLPPHPPKQLRSHRTLERIVGAALGILEEEGAQGLTVQAVVERAGSSVGSFYARFPGKNELLAYLGERVWREAAARWDEDLASQATAAVTLHELLRGVVVLLGEAVRARGTYLLALRGASGAGYEAHASFRAHVLQGVEGLLLARSEEMGHPEPEVAVRLALEAAMALLDEEAGASPAGSIPVERRVEEATRLLTAYLCGDVAGGGGPGQVDFFDIWG